MNNRNVQRYDHNSLVQLSVTALLMAIIIVIQLICTFVKFGPFSITLALAPIIIGAALYGVGTGAFLGLVFGLVVLITGYLSWDGGTVLLLSGINPFATAGLCLLKGAAAGAVSALVYRAIEKLTKSKGRLLAVVLAAIVCPVVNTGLFILGMMIFFMPTLQAWAAGAKSLIYYIVFSLVGANFAVELISNLFLSSSITFIIDTVKGKNKA